MFLSGYKRRDTESEKSHVDQSGFSFSFPECSGAEMNIFRADLAEKNT
jgi:hypothetical protein